MKMQNARPLLRSPNLQTVDTRQMSAELPLMRLLHSMTHEYNVRYEVVRSTH